LPTPEQAKSLPVPAPESLRAHDDEELSPVDQPREQDEGDSAGIVQAPRFGFPLDVERQLLTKEEVLGRQVRAP
jgi:hypothetical protein